jgi:hypothetical protein
MGASGMTFWTVKEAAAELKVSTRHIARLIAEADAVPTQSRWKWGKQLVDLGPKTSTRRTVRINSEEL